MNSSSHAPSAPSAPSTPSVPSRRTLLTAAGAVAVLAPLSFTGRAAADPGASGDTETRTLTGRFEIGAPDFAEIPVEIPRGVSRLHVAYSYSSPEVPDGTPGNALDIGIFDQNGTKLGGRGFRGWSGGFRTEFFLSRAEATPGYLAGDIDEGTWNVLLAPYQVAPQGMDYEVVVTLTYGDAEEADEPQYPPLQAPGRGRDWYRGDAHLHTVHSDGKYTPEQVATAAREAGLDFIVSTDHNTTSSHGVWGPLAGDDLLILTGEEVTTRHGHWLALGMPAGELVEWRYRNRDDEFDRCRKQVQKTDALAVSAHLYCPWIGCEWKFGLEDLDATEVWTGPWGWDDETAVSTWANLLAESARGKGGKRGGTGSWLPAMGNSDAHSPGDSVGSPHNVVLADGLSRDALLAGIRAGRSWLAESADIDLSLVASAGGAEAGIGDRLDVDRDETITVTLEVSGVPDGTVRLLTDQGQLLQTVLAGDGRGTITWTTAAGSAPSCVPRCAIRSRTAPPVAPRWGRRRASGRWQR
ncbi:CehA/McbA family metallohydrolase [Brachybacterium sp. GCM10030252]|uniref:CehA/McbA family metallohydrolase n=1 Tax=Brachybacterium sp. GCM10030252 TaxID=3273380 RepID=UPI0036155F32